MKIVLIWMQAKFVAMTHWCYPLSKQKSYEVFQNCYAMDPGQGHGGYPLCKFIRAEHKSKGIASSEMFPYMAASGHNNYMKSSRSLLTFFKQACM